MQTVVTGAWDAFATKITSFLPELIGAAIIIVVGCILARLIKFVWVVSFVLLPSTGL